jgi:hypothetical protein
MAKDRGCEDTTGPAGAPSVEVPHSSQPWQEAQDAHRVLEQYRDGQEIP